MWWIGAAVSFLESWSYCKGEYGIKGQNYVALILGSEVSAGQGCIRGIYCFIYNPTELSDQLNSGGLVASMSGFHRRDLRSFPTRARWIYFVENYIMWETGDLIFFHSVVCSVLIVDEWVMLTWCRKGLFGTGWNHVHVLRPYRNFWMHLGEYLVHAWLDLVTKLQKYTSFAYSWSTSVYRKK